MLTVYVISRGPQLNPRAIVNAGDKSFTVTPCDARACLKKVIPLIYAPRTLA